MGLFSKWEVNYCKNIDKEGDAIGLIGITLELSLVSASAVLQGKELPENKLKAFQIGFILGELSKILDLGNINDNDQINMINTVIVYWHARNKEIHSEGEAEELISSYKPSFESICIDITKLGFQYSTSDCDDGLIKEYFGITNLEDSKGFKFGVNLAEESYSTLKKTGGELNFQTVVNLAHKYYEEVQSNFIEGFIHRMDQYSVDKEIVMVAKDNDELFYIHTDFHGIDTSNS